MSSDGGTGLNPAGRAIGAGGSWHGTGRSRWSSLRSAVFVLVPGSRAGYSRVGEICCGPLPEAMCGARRRLKPGGPAPRTRGNAAGCPTMRKPFQQQGLFGPLDRAPSRTWREPTGCAKRRMSSSLDRSDRERAPRDRHRRRRRSAAPTRGPLARCRSRPRLGRSTRPGRRRRSERWAAVGSRDEHTCGPFVLRGAAHRLSRCGAVARSHRRLGCIRGSSVAPGRGDE